MSVLEKEANLSIMQDIVEKINVDSAGRIEGIVTRREIFYKAKTVVITAGTFMRGLIHVGSVHYSAGRADEFSSEGLPLSLVQNGLVLKRLKTGTPARINRNSVDFSKLEPQNGDPVPWFFSYRTSQSPRKQIPCWLTHTNEKTHKIICDNLDRSPLYGINKVIEGVGARYCPSLEDKIVRFPGKTGHHVFLEPEGFDTDEMYVNGTSNSLPEDVQTEFLRSIPGLENVKIMRMAYAIEYDYIDPSQMDYNFECRKIQGLFFGGQINGTSGYEEAAAQGFMAGVNAALRVKGRESFVLKRSEAYIGVMCDDLVSKGIDEPYRMFTSRAEHRMLLRYDNADKRLMHYGKALGLIDDGTWENMKRKYDLVDKLMVSLGKKRASAETLSRLKTEGKISSEKNYTLMHLVTMPGIGFDDVRADMDELENPDRDTSLSIEVEVKYEGYIRRHLEELERLKKVDETLIPEDLDIDSIPHLPGEVREKLKKIRPRTLGQARSLSAVTDSELTILYVAITKPAR